MGNYYNLPNISPEVVENSNFNSNSNKPKVDFKKNYLNVKLADDEQERIMTIRLLPMDLETGNPFVKVHFHTIKVPKDIFGVEWKSFVCLHKNKDIDHSRYGDKCPLCEMNSYAYQKAEKEEDKAKRDELIKLSCSYKTSEAIIVRCIERGKEDEGVKFWKFNLRDDKADPYHQMISLYNYRKEKCIEKGGEIENIFDLFNGRDLVIKLNHSKTAPVNISYDDERTPLSKDDDLMKKWIYDSKTWQEVFPVKDYNYISLVIQNKYPWYDRDNKVWVDREEFNAKKQGQIKEKDNEIKVAEDRLKVDVTPKSDFEKAITIEENNDDDLPF